MGRKGTLKRHISGMKRAVGIEFMTTGANEGVRTGGIGRCASPGVSWANATML